MYKRPIRNSLLYQYALINGFLFALLAVSGYMGLISLVYAADFSHITSVIAALFALGWGISTKKMLDLNHSLNMYCQGQRPPELGSRRFTKEILLLRSETNLMVVSNIAMSFLYLGVLGTVAGVYFALTGIGAGMSMTEIIAVAFYGAGTKLMATGTGIVAFLWLYFVNYFLLNRASLDIVAFELEHSNA